MDCLPNDGILEYTAHPGHDLPARLLRDMVLQNSINLRERSVTRSSNINRRFPSPCRSQSDHRLSDHIRIAQDLTEHHDLGLAICDRDKDACTAKRPVSDVTPATLCA